MRPACVLLAAATGAIAVAGCGAGEGTTHLPPRAGAIQRVRVGEGDRGAVVFRPAGRRRRLPVALFIHGLFATNPSHYRAWIRHLVDEDDVVIYPTYQRTFTPPAEYLANVLAGVRSALRHVPVQRNDLIVVGHSAGGALAADYAAVASSHGLPAPRLVYSVYPGRGLEGVPWRIPRADPRGIPRDTRIVALAGANDRTVGTRVAREIVLDARTVPRRRRTYRLVTDPHVDYHLAPMRSGRSARHVFWARLDRLMGEYAARTVDPDAVEIRVLGCLIEKQRTTPDQYPLTLNSLRLACNQSTNRNPVVDYDEVTTREALTRLHRRGWARLTSTQGSRAPKFRHLFDDALSLQPDEMAVLAVLMLRGPQTPGELKARTERLHAFADLAALHATVDRLIGRELVARLERRPGQKEERYVQLIGGDEDEAPAISAPRPAPVYHDVPEPAETAPAHAPPPPRPPAPPPPPAGPSTEELASEIKSLREEVAFLRTELDDLRRDLGA